MQKEYLDLRIVRTKENILQALIELMEEKEFDEITVKSIAEKARINRGTFYDHYEDKFDLVRKCQEETLEEMTYIADLKLQSLLNEKKQFIKESDSLELITTVFDYIQEHKRTMQALLSLQGDLSFRVVMKEFLWENLLEYQRHLLVDNEDLIIPKKYMASYIASAHFGVIQKWLDDGMEETPEEMGEILSKTSVRGPLELIGLKKSDIE